MCKNNLRIKLHWHRTPNRRGFRRKTTWGYLGMLVSTEVPCHPGPIQHVSKSRSMGIPGPKQNEVNPCKKRHVLFMVNPIASIENYFYTNTCFTILYIYICTMKPKKKSRNGLGDMFYQSSRRNWGRKFKRRRPGNDSQSTFRCKSSLVGGWTYPL